MAFRLLQPILRIAFRLLYYEGAWTYDLVAWVVSLGRWNGWILAIKEHIQGLQILELGHGPGHLQAALLQTPSLHVYGLDLSPYMSKKAYRRLRKKGCSPALVNGRSEMLPFRDASLDSVVTTFPTEYFHSPETLQEVHRVLKTGGRYVVLPTAWITGSKIPDRAAAWLFNVTGQAPDWADQALQPFIQAGFHAEIRWVETPGSLILIVIAEKL